MGFCNFYRRFIKDFSKTVKLLVSFIRKEYLFPWLKASQEAFQLLKTMVTSASLIKHYDRTRSTVLETNLLDYVNGRVLSQAENNEVLHLIAFYSKNLLLAECNYEIYDKKQLDIVWCFEHWRPELELTDLPLNISCKLKSWQDVTLDGWKH